MGLLTRTQIVTQGLALAGRSDLSTLAVNWLNNWLRGEYTAWPWPFIQRRAEGVSLAAGATSLLIGNGEGGVTLEVQRVLDPIFVYTSDRSTQGKARLRALTDGEPVRDESATKSSSNIGRPSVFKVRGHTSVWGGWVLYPDPIPNKDYLLAIDHLVVPAKLATDADVPVYPDDDCLVEVVHMSALRHMQRYDLARMVAAEVHRMKTEARIKFGDAPGSVMDSVSLDTRYFKR